MTLTTAATFRAPAYDTLSYRMECILKALREERISELEARVLLHTVLKKEIQQLQVKLLLSYFNPPKDLDDLKKMFNLFDTPVYV